MCTNRSSVNEELLNSPANKIFYGWWVLIGGGLVTFFAALASIHTYPAFSEAINDSFLAADPNYDVYSNWRFALKALSGTWTGLIVGVVAAPLFGLFIDRHGPRPLMLMGIAAVATGFFLITQVQNDWQKHAAVMVITTGFSATTGIVLFGTLGKWFERNRVLVFAILAASSSAPGLFTLYYSSDLIEAFGWEFMAVASGILLCFVGIPSVLIMRRRPEDFGSFPDGDGPNAEHLYHLKQVSRAALRDVLRDRAFWQVNIAIGLSLAATSGLTINALSIGFVHSSSLEFWVVAYVSGFVEVAGILIVGFIGVRRRSTGLVLPVLVILALSLAGLILVQLSDNLLFEFHLFAFFVAGRSLATASLLILQLAILAEYFGTRRFGVIVGAAFGINASLNLAFPIVRAFITFPFLEDFDAHNLITHIVGIVVLAVAATLVLNLESQSRVAARMRLARKRQ